MTAKDRDAPAQFPPRKIYVSKFEELVGETQIYVTLEPCLLESDFEYVSRHEVDRLIREARATAFEEAADELEKLAQLFEAFNKVTEPNEIRMIAKAIREGRE